MYTIIHEKLEELPSQFSISSVSVWCLKTPQIAQITVKMHYNTVTLEAVCLYSFINMYTITPEKLEHLLLLVLVSV